MDPVNKWLLVVILFMVALLFAIWDSSTIGRYEITVLPSTTVNNHTIIFVLDTKDGKVHAKLVDETDLFIGSSRIKSIPTTVFEQPTDYGHGRY